MIVKENRYKKKDVVGRIYFISNGSAIKIGFTKHEDVNIRIRQLQTASSEKLTLLYVLEGTMDVEKSLHRFFGEQHRVSGEWYNYDMVTRWIRQDKLNKEYIG